MNSEQWESLCDGCGKCCLHQLEDEDTGELFFTDVGCELLDCDTCRCIDYENRSTRVPDCMKLTPRNLEQCFEFAPTNCSYRLLSEGRGLPDWHHLVTGKVDTIHASGNSVKGRVRKITDINLEQFEDYVVDWP